MRIVALLIVLLPVAGVIGVYARARAQRALRRREELAELEAENRELDEALARIIDRSAAQVSRDQERGR